MYDDRREAVLRQRRASRETEAIVDNPLMSPEARNLLNHLLSKPQTFQINQRYVIRRGDYGGRDKVRRLFREMILAGHCTADPERNPDGTFKRGIYLVSDQPRWLAPVDISDVETSSEAGQIAEGNTPDPATGHPSVGIDNSIVNPITDTGPHISETPPDTAKLKADGRDRGRKAYSTKQAERRASGAKACLPQKEPGSRPANGSPVRDRGSGAADQTVRDRNIERMRERMFSVAGPAMANPRKAARLMSSLIQWLAQGFDFEREIIAAIADVSHRPTKPPGSIISWDYFSGAIRDRHDGHNRPARDPAPRRQLEGWTPIGTAFARRRQ